MQKYKLEIKWALIFTAMQLVWLLLERLFGFHDQRIELHPIVTNFIAIPSILIYVLALRDKRKTDLNGFMTYKEAFVSGIITTVIITILSPFAQVLISEVISPNYFSNQIAYMVKMKRMTLLDATQYFNLKNYIQQVLIFTPIMGIITTLIVAAFTKKMNPQNQFSA